MGKIIKSYERKLGFKEFFVGNSPNLIYISKWSFNGKIAKSYLSKWGFNGILMGKY